MSVIKLHGVIVAKTASGLAPGQNKINFETMKPLIDKAFEPKNLKAWLPDGMAVSNFLDCICLALWDFWTMAPLRFVPKIDPFLSLDCARDHILRSGNLA